MEARDKVAREMIETIGDLAETASKHQLGIAGCLLQMVQMELITLAAGDFDSDPQLAQPQDGKRTK